jgi:hypothetical protein
MNKSLKDCPICGGRVAMLFDKNLAKIICSCGLNFPFYFNNAAEFNSYIEKWNNRNDSNDISLKIKTAMIDFCKTFKNRQSHSTICYPPTTGDDCEMLHLCKSIEKVLEEYK